MFVNEHWVVNAPPTRTSSTSCVAAKERMQSTCRSQDPIITLMSTNRALNHRLFCLTQGSGMHKPTARWDTAQQMAFMNRLYFEIAALVVRSEGRHCLAASRAPDQHSPMCQRTWRPSCQHRSQDTPASARRQIQHPA